MQEAILKKIKNIIDRTKYMQENGLAWLGLAWLGLAWLGLAWLGGICLNIESGHTSFFIGENEPTDKRMVAYM
jgi:hypothetical protein